MPPILRRLVLRAAVMAAAAPFALAPIHAQTASQPQPSTEVDAVRALVDAAVRPVMARNDLPGLAVGVTVGGRSYVFNYGVASKATHAPVDDETLFEIGSISKTFAATLGAQAQVQGQLSLNDSPARYLPALKGHPIERTTLLQLVTYTAGGLPLQVPDDIKNDAQMQRYLQRWTPLYTPGSRRQYSNPSIGLFGEAVAAALGRPYVEAVQSDLLPGLGLRHTSLQLPEAAKAHYAWGYDKDKAVRMTPDVYDAQAYGIRTTAADLLRFVQANIDPSAVSPSLRQAIETTHQSVYQVGSMTQGLGWEHYTWPVPLETLSEGNALGRVVSEVTPVTATPAGPRLFNKTGSTRGFGAYAAFIPERRLGLVLLANRVWPIPDRVAAAHEILQKLDTLSAR
ncbi:beta-lactamase class C [Roseateles terrae]|uniref:Beta-lactamase n=2 Tax=Roseateles terrae TaxID=431060 RepID=A0ABR6GXL9_9BURK|nr:class C beta-lactamase [Roseateles terrae]MBB3196856.1 beta-lactamase class C [Roseateles terrae]